MLIEDALAVEEAGAFSVVLEAVPRDAAKKITGMLSIRDRHRRRARL